MGKSTLVNAMIGEKVAITSSRPQTTRNTIRGILNRDDVQLVLIDTPGLHKPRTALGSRLNRLVYGSLEETDAVLFVLDATQKIGPGDRLIAERLQEAKSTVVVVVNKTDIASHEQVLEQLKEAGEWEFRTYVPVSAIDGDGTEIIYEELLPLL
ncbi:MAG: GTPase Era, partial [Actinomycetota bacterium]|nr:GTPase Era [Actinomycetota bacterium]